MMEWDVFLQDKPTLRGRFFFLASLGIFFCLILVLLSTLFLQVSVVFTPKAENAGNDFLLLFLKVIGIGVAGFFFFSLFRVFRSQQKSWHDPGVENHANSGFMINTFENLLQELKAKEEALTQLKREAEDKAKRIESYNENILQSVPSGVLTFNREKIITTFNAAAQTILDLSPEATLNQSYEKIFQQNPKMLRLLNQTLEKERDMLRQDCAIEQSDGKKIWLGLSTSLLRDRHEQMIGATLVFTDLTEKKMLEEQVELKKRLVMMGEMSAWVAHEFRSYMGTILGFSRLLEKKIDKADPKQLMIQSITDELSAMEHLITELLSYSKKTVIEPAPVVLTALLQRIKTQFVESGNYSDIEWDFIFEPGFPEIKVDAVLMRQAFSNLIQNALEAMDQQGNLKIQAFLKPKERQVQIEISDTGPGISEEDLDKVFLPFFTTKTKGTGLGLALVHKTILSHNGQITVESRLSGGTCFSIFLPIDPQEIIVKEPEWKEF